MAELRKKLHKNTAGFSLSEVLVSVLIMSMVSILLVSGMRLVNGTYRKSVDKANAETLLSTTVTELRNKIAFADAVYVNDDSIGYRSSKGVSYEICNSDEGITLLTYGGTSSSSRALVSDEAAADLLSSFSGAAVNSTDGTLTIKNLQVRRIGDTSPLSSIDELVIRVQGVK